MELDKFDKAAIEGAIHVFETGASAPANRDYRKRLRRAKLMDKDNKSTEHGRQCLLYLLKHKLKGHPWR
jgi:hypothetical protein